MHRHMPRSWNNPGRAYCPFHNAFVVPQQHACPRETLRQVCTEAAPPTPKIRPEDYPWSWVCLTCHAPATEVCFSSRHALTGYCGPPGAASMGPHPAPSRPSGRQRDANGRFVHEPRESIPEDERMPAEQVLAALRPLWFHGDRGSRKPFARHVRLPFNTLHRFAKGRITLPAACLRRLARRSR
jgi:hypothetical protein